MHIQICGIYIENGLNIQLLKHVKYVFLISAFHNHRQGNKDSAIHDTGFGNASKSLQMFPTLQWIVVAVVVVVAVVHVVVVQWSLS